MRKEACYSLDVLNHACRELYFDDMRWIVDGYNVILADRKLSKLLRNSPEVAREELVIEIQRSDRLRGQRVTIIFDGSIASSTERITENLEIRFSPPRETADDMIKREVGDQLRRRSLYVVSNDRAITDFAKECGSKTVNSEDFLTLVRERKQKRNPADDASVDKPTAVGEPDRELLRLFIGKQNEK